jgi:hypothetical protein
VVVFFGRTRTFGGLTFEYDAWFCEKVSISFDGKSFGPVCGCDFSWGPLVLRDRKDDGSS